MLPTTTVKGKEISIISKQAVKLVLSCTKFVVIISVKSLEEIFNLLNFLHAVHVSA